MKKNIPPRFVHLLGAVIATIALIGLPKAGAAVITQYGFESNLVATNVDPGLTASDATLIQGLSDSGGFAGYVSNPSPTGGGTTAIQFNGTNIGGGDLVTDSAIAFTLTPDSGTALQLGLVTWWIQAAKQNAGGGSVPYTGNSTLFVSNDAFSTTLANSTLFSSTAPVGDDTTGTYVQGSFDLSTYAASFTTDTVASFRLVLSDTSSSNTRATRIDNIVVNAVPEPTAMALLLGGIGILALRRRRRARAIV